MLEQFNEERRYKLPAKFESKLNAYDCPDCDTSKLSFALIDCSQILVVGTRYNLSAPSIFSSSK